MVDRVLVVDCEPEYQIQRVMERSGLTRDEVLAIIAAQTSRERRLSEADDILHNDSDLDRLRQHVMALHDLYIRLGANR